MVYEVLETDTFLKRFGTLDKDETNWVRKIVAQIAENPRAGKPLRFDWFREKKIP